MRCGSWEVSRLWTRQDMALWSHPMRMSHTGPQVSWANRVHTSTIGHSVGVSPFDGRSGGFFLLGQWFQHSTGVSFRISSTLSCTKGFQSFPISLIQKSVTCESVKHLGFSMLNLSDRLSAGLVGNIMVVLLVVPPSVDQPLLSTWLAILHLTAGHSVACSYTAPALQSQSIQWQGTGIQGDHKFDQLGWWQLSWLHCGSCL